MDWKRDAAYIIPEIERPRIERIGLRDEQKKIYKIDVSFEEFAIDRKEFDAFAAYASSETPEIVKQNVRSTLYIPWHAPALMRTIVVGDRLLIITGNRNWTAGQNEVIVYRLPSLDYEGTFFIPFSNSLNVKWIAPYYISVDRIKEDGDYLWRYSIYRIEDQTPSVVN